MFNKTYYQLEGEMFHSWHAFGPDDCTRAPTPCSHVVQSDGTQSCVVELEPLIAATRGHFWQCKRSRSGDGRTTESRAF